MNSPNLRADIYDPKTLAAMDQAFAAVWRMLRADVPFRGYASDSELRIAIGKKLLSLVADGVTDPLRLRNLSVESLLVPLATEESSDEKIGLLNCGRSLSGSYRDNRLHARSSNGNRARSKRL